MRCQLPFLRSTLAMPLGLFGLPCEQPPPLTTAYSSPSKNTTSATPIVPPAGLKVEGNPEATVVRVPLGLILDIRAVSPPVQGPGGVGTWVHSPAVLVVPPVPASATYKYPSGPNLNPRGPSRPEASINGVGSIAGCAIDDSGAKLPTAEATINDDWT